MEENPFSEYNITVRICISFVKATNGLPTFRSKLRNLIRKLSNKSKSDKILRA